MAKILLIDDDELVRLAVRKLLEMKGHIIDIAISGEDIPPEIGDDPPDILITDIFLPKKDGLEIISEFRAILPEVKIIAMSGGGIIDVNSVLESAKRIGADRCLVKPIKSGDLFGAIKDLTHETESS